MKDSMTPNQKARVAELITRCQGSLLMLYREELGLNVDSRNALSTASEAVDEVALWVKNQPTEGQLL